VDTNGRKVALHQQLIQLRSTAHTLHKDHNLIEVERIQQVVELPIFLHLAQLDVVLFVMHIHQNYLPTSQQLKTDFDHDLHNPCKFT
jgi:hypothetical protein